MGKLFAVQRTPDPCWPEPPVLQDVPTETVQCREDGNCQPDRFERREAEADDCDRRAILKAVEQVFQQSRIFTITDTLHEPDPTETTREQS